MSFREGGKKRISIYSRWGDRAKRGCPGKEGCSVSRSYQLSAGDKEGGRAHEERNESEDDSLCQKKKYAPRRSSSEFRFFEKRREETTRKKYENIEGRKRVHTRPSSIAKRRKMPSCVMGKGSPSFPSAERKGGEGAPSPLGGKTRRVGMTRLDLLLHRQKKEKSGTKKEIDALGDASRKKKRENALLILMPWEKTRATIETSRKKNRLLAGRGTSLFPSRGEKKNVKKALLARRGG